jgi:hypothetical protein
MGLTSASRIAEVGPALEDQRDEAHISLRPDLSFVVFVADPPRDGAKHLQRAAKQPQQ